MNRWNSLHNLKDPRRAKTPPNLGLNLTMADLELGRRLYFTGQLCYEDIAENFDISVATAKAFIKTPNWIYNEPI